MYDQPGTDNLRANQQTFGPKDAPTVPGAGPDVGGRENLNANATIQTGPAKSTTKGTSDIPAYTFTDNRV